MSNGVKEGRLVEGATALTDGASQGWYIPQYVADAHPDVKTIPDALKHPELFPAPEDPSKGAVFNGPQGWGGTVATAQFFKAYDGDKHNFTLVDTGSAAGLDGSIAKANEHKQGWVGYYWSPTSLLGKYKMVRLGFGVPSTDAAEWKRCNTVAVLPGSQAECLAAGPRRDLDDEEVRGSRRPSAGLPQDPRLVERHGAEGHGLDDGQSGDGGRRREVLSEELRACLDEVGVSRRRG